MPICTKCAQVWVNNSELLCGVCKGDPWCFDCPILGDNWRAFQGMTCLWDFGVCGHRRQPMTLWDALSTPTSTDAGQGDT